jgi:Tfp pilus assembly major pilin PilA
MATIPNITEGMTWSQAFGIINQVINAINALTAAVGGAVVDGRVDYNSIINRPRINGVELVGDVTQAQLNISLDGETVERIEAINERVGGVEETLGNKLNTTDLPSTLSQAGFKTQTQLEEVFPLISGLTSRLGTLGYKTLAELGTAGYKTVVELGAAGFKTVTELGTLGYKTQAELATAGFKTQTQLEEVFTATSSLSTRLAALGYKTVTELGQAGYKTVTELAAAGYKTQSQLEEVFTTTVSLPGTLAHLGYKTQTELNTAGYRTITELGQAGYKTVTELSSLGYKTTTELATLGYMTQRELNNAGYRTVTEMATLGYRTTTELDSAGYYKKPAGGIPTSDMSSNLQTVVNQAVGAAQTATNAASTAAALPNSNVITRVNELETAVGDNTSGMQKDVNDVKSEIGNVGVNESITKDLDMTRKFINTVVDIAIEYKNDDPRRFVATLADKTKLIVK